MDSLIQELHERLNRNEYGIKMVPSEKKTVNLEYSKLINIGDTLTPCIVQWMLDKRCIKLKKAVSRTKHLMAVGSVIGRGRFDATVWGSGLLKERGKKILKRQSIYRKYDIRAVRGPLTRQALIDAGYDCPTVYGDPAILMPEIYAKQTDGAIKKYAVSLILHHRTGTGDYTSLDKHQLSVPKEIHIIDTKTDDYQSFIDEIVASQFVVSSSLHGIILAESYGIPAVFLNWGVDNQILKYEDWYGSTGRALKSASSISKAIEMEVPPVPDLYSMREKLKACFPYDLWEN